MDGKKWDSVLIDWVNCLKLGKNISSIDELKAGEFFSNLQKVITKTRDSQCDSLTFIFDLLGKHYPNFSFENKTEIHLTDLPEPDLKAITSLLMHYTCMYDRKDVLTSPLCHSLSQSTQLIVRNFLQKTPKNVTNDTIDNIIKTCIEDASDHQWLTVEKYSARNSPLQDILKTPISKFGRLQEKDRMITKLKSELETERYDKADLQEELKFINEKNRKIEQQLVQKNSEISRLRDEIEALENSTPPNSQDTDSRELQSRLRSEIQSLEQYIKQIENEQDEIKKEKDATKEMLRKIELQAMMWEEKFFETERNFESLSEHSRKQEDELKQLQEHCSELTAMLEEYKAKPANDSSLYDTFTSSTDVKYFNETPPAEDLACSVVEVQLRDAQKQIEELKNQLEKNEQTVTNLKNVVSEIEEKLMKSNEFNEELKQQMRSLEMEKSKVEKQLTETENFFLETKKIKEELVTEVAALTGKLEENERRRGEMEVQNGELILEVQKVQSSKDEIEKQLLVTVNSWENEKKHSKIIENELTDLKKLSEKLQFELADATLQNEKVNSQIVCLNKEMETLINKQQEIENIRITLEKHLFESQSYSENLKSHLEQLRFENQKLNELLEINRTELNKLQNNNTELNSELKKVSDESRNVQENNDLLSQEIQTLQTKLTETLNNLQTSHEKNHQFESEISVLKTEKQRISEQLDSNITLLTKNEEETKCLLQKLQESEDSRDSFSQKYEALLLQNSAFEKQLHSVTDQLKVCEKDTENLKEIQIHLKKELQDSKNLSEQLNTELDAVKNENGMIKEENRNLSGKVEDFQKQLSLANEELKIRKEETNNLKKELSEVKIKIETSKQDFEKVVAEKETLNEKFNESSNNLREAANKNEDLLAQIKKQEENIRSIEKKIQSNEIEITELVNIKSSNEKELEELKKSVEVLEKELENSKLDKEILNEVLTSVRRELSSLNEEQETSLEEISNLEKDNTNLNNTLAQTLNDVKMLKSKLETLQTELNESKDSFTKVQTEKKSVDSKYQQLQVLNENLEKQLNELESHSKVQQNELQKLECENRTTTENLTDLEKENENLFSTIRDLETQNSHLLIQKDNLEKQLFEETKNFEDVERQLREMFVVVEETQIAKQKTNEDYMNLKNENQILLAKIMDYEEKCANLEEKLCEVVNNLLVSSKDLENLHRLRNELENQIEEANMEKGATVGLLNQLKEERQFLRSQVKQLEDNYKDLEKKNRVVVSLNEELEAQYNGDVELKTKLIEEKELIERDLKNQSEFIKQLELNSQQSQTKIEDLLLQNEVLMKEISVKAENVDNLEKKQQEMKNELEKQICDNDATVVLLNELKEERQRLEMKVEELEKKNSVAASLTEDLEAQSKENEEAKAKLIQEKEQIEANLQQKTEDLQKKIEDLMKEINVKAENLEDLEKKHQQLKVNFDTQIEDKNTTVALLNELKEERQCLKLKVEELEKKNRVAASLTEDLEAQGKENEEAKAKWIQEKEQIEANLQQKTEDLQKKIEDLLSQNETLQNEVSVKSEAVVMLEREQKELKNNKQILDKQLSEVSELSEVLKAESEKLRLEYHKSKVELEEIRDGLSKATDEKNKLHNQLKDIKEKNQILYKENSEHLEKLEKIEMERNLLKEELDNALKQTENLTKKEDDRVFLKETVEKLTTEKSVLEKQIEIEEIVSLETKDKMKSLEETIQDYEITISGLKNVVDKNLESLESLKTELSEQKDKETQIMKTVSKMVGDEDYNNTNEFQTFICIAFENLLATKKHEEQRRIDLEIENDRLKSNTTFQEMIEKLQTLVMEQNEIVPIEALKSNFDKIHTKFSSVIKAKLKLEEDLDTIQKKNQNLEKEKKELEEKNRDLESKLKPTKVEKENILGVSTKPNKSREEELKKENMSLRRKLVLAENAKNNLEKVLKELREKKVEKETTTENSDALYKKLLQEYIQVKEENEKYNKEKDNATKELQNVRDAYEKVISINGKLELEVVNLRKKIEERNCEVSDMGHIKEAYERLLEQNNKFSTEIDTLSYKRMRDKDEFVRLLKEERDKTLSREAKKIQEIRNEYEGKLEKMKEKMLKLYREEVNKKARSTKDGQFEHTNLIKTISNLRSELFECHQKIQFLEMDRESYKSNRNIQMQRVSSVTSITKTEERASTLPRSSITEEVTYSRRTSIGGIPNPNTHLQMEDEEDLFNEKYLTDLKEGRCNLQTDRFSELAWRNSMVPPHLKSSYPAETQFISPSRFKDEDIKTGNIEFEDSLCKLLPGEKPRKKDFGTTSYKKPGPPTPSKNGGRLSLQGNEVHPMREHCETKTPKKSTPSRIRALFTGRLSSTRENSDSQVNVTPSRGKRLSIFRRPR